MCSLVIFISSFAIAESSKSLPEHLRALAESTDAFADSIAKLEKETDAVARDAHLVHKVSANKTARALILDDMGRTLKQGMPSTSTYDDAETAVHKAAAEYTAADRVATQAEHKLQQRSAKMGNANLTAAQEAQLQSLRKAAREADAERASARTDL